jgi:hypothetical protein
MEEYAQIDAYQTMLEGTMRGILSKCSRNNNNL